MSSSIASTYVAEPTEAMFGFSIWEITQASGPDPFAPPPGSYMAQCKNADMAGPILRALCKASDGSRVDTTINTLDCRGRDISVKPNSKLTCK